MSWPFPDDHMWSWRAPGPTGSDRDERIAAAVARRLAGDAAVRGRGITVTAQNAVVILTGVVADADTRRLASSLAWQVDGVADVCNSLRPPRPRRLR
ncbi:BON domain-containing protein [Micromonospora sp. NPDC050686]|uniref:BON domain-containing protein n=1 Tax=Micromonospora sp. NPDC050686 TaxID=3154631 RepID=UPI0033C82AC1